MGLVPAAHGGSVHVEPVAGSAGAAGLDGEVGGPAVVAEVHHAQSRLSGGQPSSGGFRLEMMA